MSDRDVLDEFPICDVDDDLVVQSWNNAITDEEPDPIRGRASAHRGDSYLNPNYPPHGQSSGEAGGSMRPKIEVEVMGGTHDRGLDAIGALPGAITRSNLVNQAASRIQFAKTAAQSAARSAGASSAVQKAAGVAAGAKAGVIKRAGFKVEMTPAGRKTLSLKVNKSRAFDFKTAQKNAADVGKRAVTTGKNLVAALKKGKVTGPPAKSTAKPTAVRGVVPSRPTARPPTRGTVRGPARPVVSRVGRGVPLSRMTPAQLKSVADRAIKNGQDLQKLSSKFGGAIKTFDAKKKVTKFRGDEGEVGLIADVADTILGEQLADQYMDIIFGQAPDPNNPGFLTDGSLDPSYVDPGMDPTLDPGGYGLDAGPPDYGFGSPPTLETLPPMQEGVDFEKDRYATAADDPATYSSVETTDVPGAMPVPIGAVYYEGQKPFTWQALGSQTRFKGGAAQTVQARGELQPGLDREPIKGFSTDDWGWGNSGFQLGGGNAAIMDGWYVWLNGNYDGRQYKKDEPGGGLGGAYSKSMKDRARRSVVFGWGPICGDPRQPDWANIRYDVGADKWFWFWDKAPTWATDKINAMRLQKAIVEYRTNVTAAAADAAAKVLQDKLDAQAAAQQAKQDAADAATLTKQLDTEQQVAQSQSAVQALQDERELASLTAMQAAQDDSYTRQQAADDERALRQQQVDEEREMRRAQYEEERQVREEERRAAAEDKELETLMRLSEQEAQQSAWQAETGEVPQENEVSLDDEVVEEYEDAMEQPDEVMGHAFGLRAWRERRAARDA